MQVFDDTVKIASAKLDVLAYDSEHLGIHVIVTNRKETSAWIIISGPSADMEIVSAVS